jgi:hypothetical protein
MGTEIGPVGSIGAAAAPSELSVGLDQPHCQTTLDGLDAGDEACQAPSDDSDLSHLQLLDG